MTVSITKLNNADLLLCVEYFPPAINKIKRLGGAKWEASLKGWIISSDFYDEAKGVLIEYFGTDGSFREKQVNIELIANQDIVVIRKPVMFAGKIIAQAFNRDSGARVGVNVSLKEGKIDSGGSAKNWETIIEKGSRFKLMHVNERILSFEEENEFSYEIIQKAAKSEITQLSRLRHISDEELIQECISRSIDIKVK